MKKYGRWNTEKSIDEGGQGYVYLVTDSEGEKPGYFALKRLRDPSRTELFDREIRVIRRLNHPNIIRVEDFGVARAKPYYVMEYFERGSLNKVGGSAFTADLNQAVAILIPVCSALSAAHKEGVIHRDLKPPNILLRGDGTPVLADFGICHLDGDERVTMTDKAMGARDYTAPEMESGGGRRFGGPTDKTDVYGLGKVLYWMLSGGAIFSREDHRSAHLSDLLGAQKWEHVHMFLDHVLREKPSERLGVEQFVKELQQVRHLVMGDFAPLKPSIGITCRFCGLGKYERLGDKVTDKVATLRSNELGMPGQVVSANLMTCSNCGHLELFDFRRTSAWWTK
ncbi:MAG: serine/threonine protein kinase [Steroidobacteraceae bacterium]|jgi:serine/threonine protein kinase